MARLHLFLPPVDCVKQFKREIGVNDQVSRFYEGGPLPMFGAIKCVDGILRMAAMKKRIDSVQSMALVFHFEEILENNQIAIFLFPPQIWPF